MVVVQVRHDDGIEPQDVLTREGIGYCVSRPRVNEQGVGPVTDEDRVPLSHVKHGDARGHENVQPHEDRDGCRKPTQGDLCEHPPRWPWPKCQKQQRRDNRKQLHPPRNYDGNA